MLPLSNPKPLNPKPQNLNPKPLNPKPKALNPKPDKEVLLVEASAREPLDMGSEVGFEAVLPKV